MFKIGKNHIAAMMLASVLLGLACIPGSAATSINGQVQAGGGPVAGATVTLWAASAGEPQATCAGSNRRRRSVQPEH